MACSGCGEQVHEAWECSNHVTFTAWRDHFASLPNNYTLKTTKALHLSLQTPYIPPRSPHNLMQECLYSDPWKVLVCCLCLNATSGKQTRKVLLQFFDKYPTPQSVIANVEGMTEILKPLGLWKKRPQTILQMSRGYLESEWTVPSEIFGVGKYANDAYLIFCCGQWKDVKPQDHMLNDYVKFLYDSHGLEFKEDPNVKKAKRKQGGNVASSPEVEEVSKFFVPSNKPKPNPQQRHPLKPRNY